MFTSACHFESSNLPGAGLIFPDWTLKTGRNRQFDRPCIKPSFQTFDVNFQDFRVLESCLELPELAVIIQTIISRKAGWYGWKPTSSSTLSIRAFRAYPLIWIRRTVPCRAIRGSNISVKGTLPPLNNDDNDAATTTTTTNKHYYYYYYYKQILLLLLQLLLLLLVLLLLIIINIHKTMIMISIIITTHMITHNDNDASKVAAPQDGEAPARRK